MATEIVYAVWPAPVWPLIATAMLATDRGDGVGEFASQAAGRHGHGQSSPSGPRPQQSSNCRLRCSGRCDLARKGLRSWVASNCSLSGVTQAPVAHLGPFNGVRERGCWCSMLRRRSRRACFSPERSAFLAVANLRHLRCATDRVSARWYRRYRLLRLSSACLAPRKPQTVPSSSTVLIRIRGCLKAEGPRLTFQCSRLAPDTVPKAVPNPACHGCIGYSGSREGTCTREDRSRPATGHAVRVRTALKYCRNGLYS
eukprot:scaffold28410_cov55-Phaeocystis_antarctica.AAC.5